MTQQGRQRAHVTTGSNGFLSNSRSLAGLAILTIKESSKEAVGAILHLRKRNDEIKGQAAKWGSDEYIPIPVRWTYNSRYLNPAINEGRPVCYRFQKEDGQWYVQAMMTLPPRARTLTRDRVLAGSTPTRTNLSVGGDCRVGLLELTVSKQADSATLISSPCGMMKRPVKWKSHRQCCRQEQQQDEHASKGTLRNSSGIGI